MSVEKKKDNYNPNLWTKMSVFQDFMHFVNNNFRFQTKSNLLFDGQFEQRSI